MKVLVLLFCIFVFCFGFHTSLQAFSSPAVEGFSSESASEYLVEESLRLYFFNDAQASADLDWEFLRQGATRVGVTYPKYYLWVKVSREGRVLSQGAACLAVMGQGQLMVTDYFNLSEIQKSSPRMQAVFPKSVLHGIKQHATNR